LLLWSLRAFHRTIKVSNCSSFLFPVRVYDVQYHDGGTVQEEAIETYQRAIQLASEKRRKMIEEGEETNRALTGTVDVNEEITLDYSARSIDGLLCALHTALGKTYFMANMFEKAVESYSSALELESLYLDAMSSRGSSRIILGHYEEAAQDFMTVMKQDSRRRFQDVFTGMARVLQANETAVPGGWEPMIQILEEMIPLLEDQVDSVGQPEGRVMLSNTLNRFYHVLFLYHDVKTNDTDAAWENLRKSYHHKMSALPAWNAGFEGQKIAATKQIFNRGFWPVGVGSETKVPIFVIGFVRSGSTLLERVLDAHPQIVGTGENSVFNGQLDQIRNKLVETSMLGDADRLASVIQSLADGVVNEMRHRWKMVANGENRAASGLEPDRFVDKMLTNYYNVGFIHMLFPNALILHVAREPMDTIFSAYKHEFPQGPLDYTSEFKSLAELYHGYRDLMEHWDRELPGRVTHIRYEDMVHDMPGVARKIIDAAGLEWNDGVLDFHKKKQAVNTLSTTQVRKGVYKDSLEAWRRYEKHLEPLTELIGDRTSYDLRTTLAGYQGPTSSTSEENGGEESAFRSQLSKEESPYLDSSHDVNCNTEEDSCSSVGPTDVF
jgi:tetratricopeptide (TPR) repeat protein